MQVGLSLFAVAFCAYFIGTVNFAKIISWNARRKDITKIGSKNPGTMNMLRSHGFGLALATFVCEIVKSGLTCLLSKLCFEHFGMASYGDVAYFTAGLFIVLGYDFPVWSKFKGGKGVAVFAGVFLFSHLWYVAIGWFVICFALLVLVDIGSVISFTYTGGLTVAYILYAWLLPLSTMTAISITAVLGFLYILMLAKHHANLKRLFTGTENKVGFKDKLKKVFHSSKDKTVSENTKVDAKTETMTTTDEKNDQ